MQPGLAAAKLLEHFPAYCVSPQGQEIPDWRNRIRSQIFTCACTGAKTADECFAVSRLFRWVALRWGALAFCTLPYLELQ